MSTPELAARVEAILASRAAHRRQLSEWQKAAKPDKLTSETEWRKHLDPAEYEVLRTKGTERQGGEYDGFYPSGEGYFACRGCGAPLYSAAAKFRSSCGWPAFDKCFKGAVQITADDSHDMMRIEITCARCGGHLGHVFAGERKTPTNERHCVNSVSCLYVPGVVPREEAQAAGGALSSTAPDHAPDEEETVLTMRNLAKLRR